MADSPEAIKKATRTYLFVGGMLFIGTLVTVLVATVPALDIGVHGFDVWDMWLGLAIAATKASLVGYIFMHLNHEKFAVYWIFGLGLAGALFLAGLLALADSDPIHDSFFYGARAAVSESR
jgi:cytochrome c oxidase subunit IV